MKYSNQEELERIKKETEDHKLRCEVCIKSKSNTQRVIDTIRDALIELLLKLQEIDENVEMTLKRKPILNVDIDEIVSGKASNEQLVALLEEKIKMGMIAAGQLANDADSGVSEEEIVSESREEIVTPSATGATGEGIEKAANYPPIYGNLISRTTGQPSTSPAAQAG